MCLLFVEIDDFEFTETENMHCAKLPDAQDDRVCSYQETNNNVYSWSYMYEGLKTIKRREYVTMVNISARICMCLAK